MKIKEPKEEERSYFVKLALTIIITLPFLFLLNLFDAPRLFIRELFSPLERSLQEMISQVKKGYDQFKDLRKTEEENRILKERIVNLLNENASLKKENEDLKAALKDDSISLEEEPKVKIFAHVIGREPATFLKNIVLDKGASAGVEVGQAVASGGVLLARVSEVRKESSVALIIFSHLSLIQVRHNQTRTLATARGDISGLLITNYPKDSSLQKGDLFVTSGLDEKIPAGLIVGTVENFSDQEASFFKTAVLSSPLSSLPESVTIYGK